MYINRRARRSYGNDPLPTPAEALAEPFAAFPSWFLRIECDRCGKLQMVNESHARSHAAPNTSPDASQWLRPAPGIGTV